MVSYGTTNFIAAPAVAGYGTPTMTNYAAAPVMSSYAAPAMTNYAAAPAMTSYAAPAMTNYAAAPAMASYAAPAMTNYAAAPAMTTMAAPAMTSYAAPAMPSYAAPAMTTMAPSFVAPPAAAMMAAMPGVAMPQAAMAPQLPVRLTEGIPTPEQILAQKNGYSMALDKQLKEAADTVVQENAIEKEMVKFTAAKNIALYEMQVDEQLVEALAQTDEQGTIAHCELKKALVERNLQLNGQASNLLMDYQMKALVTECEMKKYAFAQQYMKAEAALGQQMVQQEMKAATGTAYAAPAQAVI